MKTGSPLLFTNKSLFSWLIRSGNFLGMGLTGLARTITHIEMAIWSSDFDAAFRASFNMQRDTWYSLRSTKSSDVKDVFGEVVEGVSIVRLQSVVDTHPGKIYVREINEGPSDQNLQDLEVFITEFYGKGYEKNIAELVLSALDRSSIVMAPNDETVFCSEIFTLIYRLWKWVEVQANEMVPANYAIRTKFLRGRFYGPMKLLRGRV